MFGRGDDAFRGELQAFWAKIREPLRVEMKHFASIFDRDGVLLRSSQRPLRRQAGAIARDDGGTIIGIVFVLLREVAGELHLGTHAYSQRIYIVPTARNIKLMNRLFNEFLVGFEASMEQRDHRAKALISINNNSCLKTAYMRRYFTLRGFRLLVPTKHSNEIWVKSLQTRFLF